MSEPEKLRVIKCHQPNNEVAWMTATRFQVERLMGRNKAWYCEKDKCYHTVGTEKEVKEFLRRD